MHTHKKKTGDSFVQDKARIIAERYTSLEAERSSQGEAVDSSQLFYEAVGGHDKRQRVYGLGICATEITRPSRPSSSTGTSGSSYDIQHLVTELGSVQRQMQEREELMQKEREEREQLQKQMEQMQQTNEQWKKEMEEQMRKDMAEQMRKEMAEQMKQAFAAALGRPPSSSQPPDDPFDPAASS